MTAKNIIRFLVAWIMVSPNLFAVPNPEPLIDVQKINARIRGATSRCYLRKTVALHLDGAQRELEPLGLCLKIMDAYRPLSEQKKLWKESPDKRYVANPKHGSRHNRGAAVDLRLARLEDGKELIMPSTSFSRACHRNYEDMPSEEMKKNCKLLELVMEKHGFIPLPTEWWHFDHKNWADYDVLNIAISDLTIQDDLSSIRSQGSTKKQEIKKKKTVRKKRKKNHKKKLTLHAPYNKLHH